MPQMRWRIAILKGSTPGVVMHHRDRSEFPVFSFSNPLTQLEIHRKETIILGDQNTHALLVRRRYYALCLPQVTGERLLNDDVLPGRDRLFHIRRVQMPRRKDAHHITFHRTQSLVQSGKTGGFGQARDLTCLRKGIGRNIHQRSSRKLLGKTRKRTKMGSCASTHAN